MLKLQARCERRISERFNREDECFAAQRLQDEIEVIEETGLLETFEEAVQLASHIWKQGGFCRLFGAGCSSLVTYLLDLSHVDPICHRLPFERFLKANPTRSVPLQLRVEPRWGGTNARGIVCHSASFHELLPHRTALEIKKHQPDFSLNRIPQDDPAVYALLESGDLADMPQLNNDEIRQVMAQTSPRSIGEIAAIRAAYQIDILHPDTLTEFRDQSNHSALEQVTYPVTSKTRQETRGVILFQEQIMLLLNQVAGFTFEDGYQFIKAASKRCTRSLVAFRERFFFGAKSLGLSEGSLSAVLKEFENAAIRSVCKSHFLAEAVLSYQAAYLRAHYPESFNRAICDVPF